LGEQLRYRFGIDFGTTNSATVGYAFMGSKYEQLLYGDDEQRPVPSVVAVHKKTGEVFTGRKAWERRQELSQDCEFITSVKSLLNSEWSKMIAGKKWTAVEVAAEVFKGLQKNVHDRTGIVMDEAVVAIPVGLSAGKRRLLREAAALAGLKISSFISEPTAAFFANYPDIRNDNTVVVFDWGGGTLDVSVLKHNDGKIFELATGGHPEAGDAIDLKIAEKVHARIARKKKINISFEDMPAVNRDMMLVRSERAKRALYDDDTATISINNYGEFGAVRETLDYDWFSEIISTYVDKAIECFDRVVSESGVGINNIDRIIMVGGSSNLRPLTEKLDSRYGDRLYFPEETMWNVGTGAAMLSATPGGYYSNQKIGVILSDNTLFPLLKENEKIEKWSARHHFAIVDTNQEARFIFGGSADLEQDDDKYVTLQVPAYVFLQEQIILDANIDDDLVFNVIASSTMRTEEYRRIWKYERLKCYYQLPKEGGVFV
jgi:molecular chaperone DnaK